MVRIEEATFALPGETAFRVITPLFCEDGHRTDALNTVSLDNATGKYYIITGDAWWFCDFCKPCKLYKEEICWCDQCEKGFRTDLSRENGRRALDREVTRILVGGC